MDIPDAIVADPALHPARFRPTRLGFVSECGEVIQLNIEGTLGVIILLNALLQCHTPGLCSRLVFTFLRTALTRREQHNIIRTYVLGRLRPSKH